MLGKMARKLELFFQLINFYGKKKIAGGKLLNLLEKKKLCLIWTPNRTGLLHLFLKRIGRPLGNTQKGLGLPGREGSGTREPIQKRPSFVSSENSIRGL